MSNELKSVSKICIDDLKQGKSTIICLCRQNFSSKLCIGGVTPIMATGDNTLTGVSVAFQ